MIYRDQSGRLFGTGLIPTPEGAKREFCSRYAGAAIPRGQWKTIDYQSYCPDVYDQGQQGSCVGHGGVGSFALARALAGHGPARLSACNLYGQINGGQDQGASVADALKALRDGPGVCLESTVTPTHWQPSSWPAGWKDEAARFKIEKADEIQGFDEIATAVQEGDPVCFGVILGNNFEPGSSGAIPDWDGQEAGGHCMFAAGLALVGSKWHLKVQNSWGTRWGQGGYCYLPESYFKGWHEAYRIKAAIDDPKGDNPPTEKD